jgi:integrase/recombinase XerD
MKKLELNHAASKEILSQFERNLKTLNYSKDTVYNATNGIKEYLHYLQKQELDVKATSSKTIAAYFDYLKTRTNVRRGGGLSIAYLKKHRCSLKQFYTYLNLSGYYTVNISYPILPRVNTHPKVLSIVQIKQLFSVCDDGLQGKRNKALLALYYGCGLRRKEGVMLNVEDIDLHKSEVFVSKSKTRTQRHVPMNEGVQKLLEDYLFNAREMLLPSDTSESALLITQRGKRISPENISYVMKNLLNKSEITTKNIGLHTLRHSIATHLLQAGMKLEDIALFLGHKSIDSTQIYTHLGAETPSNETIIQIGQ